MFYDRLLFEHDSYTIRNSENRTVGRTMEEKVVKPWRAEFPFGYADNMYFLIVCSNTLLTSCHHVTTAPLCAPLLSLSILRDPQNNPIVYFAEREQLIYISISELFRQTEMFLDLLLT